MAEIVFYNIPEMDITYENIPMFRDRSGQTTWMNQRRVVTIDGKISVDPTRTSVTVGRSYQELEQLNVDYCSLTDASGKRMYYFITDYEYKTTGATTMILQLDAFQTYFFDCELMDSFIDRCHVPRWTSDMKPMPWYYDEGLQYGDYVILGQSGDDKAAVFRDKYLISSTTPLGENDWVRPSGGGSGGDVIPSGDEWKSGMLSRSGFRFIKGFEGYAERPYLDTLAKPPVNTICYGVTERAEPAVYNQLVTQVPVPEEVGAKVSYELKNRNYGRTILNTCHRLGITKQYQFDALVSFSYNLGPGIINDSNSAIYKAIKADITNEDAIRAAFVKYNQAGGRPEEGLTARRNAECDMFFGKQVEFRPILTVIRMGVYGPPITENDGNGWLPQSN